MYKDCFWGLQTFKLNKLNAFQLIKEATRSGEQKYTSVLLKNSRLTDTEIRFGLRKSSKKNLHLMLRVSSNNSFKRNANIKSISICVKKGHGFLS